MENKNKNENIVNASNEALNEPIKEDVEGNLIMATRQGLIKKTPIIKGMKVFFFSFITLLVKNFIYSSLK